MLITRLVAAWAILCTADAVAADRTFEPLHAQNPAVLSIDGPRADVEEGEVLLTSGERSVRYRAADGRVIESRLPVAFRDHALERTRHGWVFAGGITADGRTATPSDRVMVLRPNGRALSGRLSEARIRPVSARLSDDAVLVVGGRRSRELRTEPGGPPIRSSTVDLIEVQRERIVVSRLPDLPGPPRHGFRLIALEDGSALVLGGEPGDYDACHACLREAWRLDRTTRTWRPVAPMSVGRAAPATARLPDGRVLVAGGWVPGRQDATASAEVFDPRTERWSPFPALPSPLANAGTHWLAGSGAGVLLVGGGTNPQIHALDVAHAQWRTVGASQRVRIRAELVSYRDGRGQPWVVMFGDTSGPRGQDRTRDGTVERIALRLPGESLDASAPYRLGRAAPALAVHAEGSVTFVGGAVDGDPGSVATAAVDELRDSPPRLNALPAAPDARAGAFAAWLDPSTLVFAGGHRTGYDAPVNEPLSVDVFESASGRWRAVTHPNGKPLVLDAEARFAATPDGALVAIHGATATRYRIADGIATALPLPPAPRARRQAVVRAFDDGRIVVAGGEVQTDRIVTVDTARAVADGPDVYEGFGPFRPAHRHALYDPASRSWRESAPATLGESAAAILHDGRVARVGTRTLRQPTDASPGEYVWVCEISDAEGARWRPLPPPDMPARPGDLRLQVQREELLLEAPLDGRLALLRFDTAAGRWVTLQTWEPLNRDVGRLTVHELPDKRLVWVWP